jgi:integrase
VRAITTAAVEKFIKDRVPDGKPHVTLRSGDGLCLRVLRSGSASWQFVYRLKGGGRREPQRTVTIGAWPAIGVKTATEEARRLAGEVASGREAKRRERAVVAVALDDYQAWIMGRRLRKVPTMMSSLRRGLGHVLRRDLAELDRKTVIDAIERIERTGRIGAARDFRKHLRSFLNRQLSVGVIAVDPLAGYRRPAATKDDILEAEERGRALGEREIVAVWRAATALGAPFGNLVKMGLLTGLRRGELAALQWDWIDRDGQKITIPGKTMKSGREHALPITGLIAKLLDETPDRAGGLVFPSERRAGGSTPLSGWSKLLHRLRSIAGVEGVALHDLRRTYRSVLADLGVREEIAEAMIAHRRPSLVTRYNRAQIWDQRREAAEMFDGHISALVVRFQGLQADNVASISPAKLKRMP